MSGSQMGGRASAGTVAFGVALLFGCGAFGFYLLTEVAGPNAAPLAPFGWSPEETEEGEAGVRPDPDGRE